MTTSQQITKFLVDAIAYHEDRALRFRKTLDCFQETGSQNGGMVINLAKPPMKRAPRGSHLETIRAHLSNGRSKPVQTIALECNIPRSSVSTVLRKHNRTFKFDSRDKRWSLRKFVLTSK